MANDDVDDIFKDFEHKVEDKEETDDVKKKETHKSHEKELSDEETLKRKYEKAEQVLKHKYKKEKEALEDKKEKEVHGHGEIPHRNIANIERVAYVAIILILVVYVGIDLTFYHKDKSVEVEDQTITAAAVKQEDETEEIVEVVEEEEEEVVVEEKPLSGKITLTLDKVYTDVDEGVDDKGYISKIVFTIENGKETVLTPVINVFIYDDRMHESWETISRGQYTYAIGINSGKVQTGSLSLSPKTYRNLDIKKNIRVELKDAEEGFITAVNDKITIS